MSGRAAAIISAMKLLLFSDVHSDLSAVGDLVRRATAVDVVVCAGDLCNLHARLTAVVKALKAIDKPTVLVAGNNETADDLFAACAGWPSAVVLHGTGADILGVPFFGVGGGIPVTPFGDWSYDFTEADAEKLLAGCPSGGVLVTHSPPFGVLDVSSSGRSLGSTAIRAAMERCRPKLLVCGHIHGSGGKQQQAGDTLVVNAGPAGMLVEV